MRNKALFFIVCAILLTRCTRYDSTAQWDAVDTKPTRLAQGDLATTNQPSYLAGQTATVLLVAGAMEPSKIARVESAVYSRPRGDFSSLGAVKAGLFSSTSPSLGDITIGGHVINSSGGNNPVNTFVTLVIYENDQIVNQIKIPLDDAGAFVFNQVPWNPNYTYLASVMYNNIEFDSDLVDGGILMPGTAIHLSLAVYDVSTNAQFLEGVRMRVTYDFTSPGWVHVVEGIVISNPTSFVIGAPADGSPILDFPLPKTATDVTFPNGNASGRFRMTSDGFGDWQPVMPGNGHQVIVEYSLPFTNSWRHELEMPIAVDSFMVMVKASGIVVSGNELQLSFTQSNTDGLIRVYTSPSIEPGGKISISFTTEDQVQRIWLGIGIFIATLLFALVWIVYRSNHLRNHIVKMPTVAENGENVDTILDAIIALDDRFRHGDIAEDGYRRARAEYVDKLEAFRDHFKE